MIFELAAPAQQQSALVQEEEGMLVRSASGALLSLG